MVGVGAGIPLACSQDLRVSGSSVGAPVSQAQERPEIEDREQGREEAFRGRLEESRRQGAQAYRAVQQERQEIEDQGWGEEP